MKRYKLLNNVLGWVVFVIAAVTYILTLESTASFWDCGEFIIWELQNVKIPMTSIESTTAL